MTLERELGLELGCFGSIIFFIASVVVIGLLISHSCNGQATLERCDRGCVGNTVGYITESGRCVCTDNPPADPAYIPLVIPVGR